MTVNGPPVALDGTELVESPTSSYAQNGRKAQFKNMKDLALLNHSKLLEFFALLLDESLFSCGDDLASSSTSINSKKDNTEIQSEKNEK